MLKRIFRSQAVAAPSPTLPADMRVYAIGDVHGCRAQLDALLAAIEADTAARPAISQTVVVFLGDLVDRGPDTAGVIAHAMACAERFDCRFITGNHEEVFLLALAGDREALRMFCRIGGRETLLSYGLSADEYERMDYDDVATFLATAVPREQRAFLEAGEDMVVLGDYAFVHAGVRPDVALEAQRTADLRWIRDSFLRHRGGFEKTIVHGHSISPAVDRAPGRIGIDTGAYKGGPLTAIGLEAGAQWFLSIDPMESGT